MNKKEYKILCIDDEKDVLEMRKHLIEDEMGFTVLLAENSDQALEHLNKNSDEILFIISDHEMPGLKGLEFRQHILEDYGQIPFAVVSGYLTKEMALRGIELKICAFLDKPVDDDKLIELVETETKAFIEEKEEEAELIDGFVDDTKGLLSDIEDIILQMEEDPNELSQIDDLMRLLHTIKGTSSCVGLKRLSKFAHKFEDIATEIKKSERSVNTALISAFLKGYDFLKHLMENAQTSNKIDIQPGLSLFEDLDDKEIELFEDEPAQEASKENEPQKMAKKVQAPKREEIAVTIDILDRFMELSGDLTVSRNTAIKMTQNIENQYTGNQSVENLSTALSEMNKISTQMQNLIVETRKVSLKNVFKPLPRIVRDVSKSSGKKTIFECIGDDLRVDNIIAKVLTNSLVHMVRNAVDHAIETPEERTKNQKDEQGLITITSYEEGEDVIVEVKDNGRGISPELIKKKLIANEAFTAEELTHMSKRKLLSMIFHPGFSTAAQVTDISGRGVGMDMVLTSVKGIGGQILTESEVGVGTTFKMILPKPKSVLILNALFVQIKDLRLAIAQDEISRVIHMDEKVQEQIVEADRQLFLKYQDNQLLPILHVDNLLNLCGKKPCEKNLNDAEGIIILRHEDTFVAILVNRIYDVEEIVVKKFEHSLKKLSIYSGVTYGEGSELHLVLSTKGILEAAEVEASDSEIQDERDEDLENQNESSEMIEVHVKAHGRYLVPLDQVYRFENIKSEKLKYRLGQPILPYNDKTIYIYDLNDLVLNGTGLAPLSLDLKKSLEEDLNVLVFNYKEAYVGFVVEQIGEIYKVFEDYDKGLSDREAILGAIRHNNIIFSLLNMNHLLKQIINPEVKLEEGEVIHSPVQVA